MNTTASAALDTLEVTRLRQLVQDLDIPVADRRSRAELVRALAKVPLKDMASSLTAPDLRSMCAALGLNEKGTKAVLVARLVEAIEGPSKKRAPEEARAPTVGETGTLKSALRRFALDAAGGFRGKDATTQFATALLTCFGWPKGRPEGAEMPATLRIAEHGKHTTRQVELHWPKRHALLDVTHQDTGLDVAWKELLSACLQLDPVPQWVVLTNQRELRLYDLSRDRSEPRLSTSLDDLAKHAEAFPFLAQNWQPGATPRILNTDKVSKEVAELVARLYRSLKSQHPKREDDVIQFTLQCIITMFAEDIGLLPRQHFTSLLYEGARKRDAEKRLRELFHQMSSKDVQRPPAVAYFNGGLFKDPVTVPLGDEQLAALTKAAEANWRYVDPHIFGSVFQGIMGDAERHATGAHYTAHDDIMRVVGPTIVEPWRKRIQAATTLADLVQLRADLFKFRVLDPACGSGNFLYVAFKELYALDTELLRRIREFPAAKDALKPTAWTLGIPATNFYGIDTNKFAVELAKVTLNIAKKIAFEERKARVASFSAQLEIDVEPSLPLDNLNDNIVCADALFTEWPKVDAIVGNPPFLGTQKMRKELGVEYMARLQTETGLDGVVDMACYWFRRAHDRLAEGGRAGLVATSGIRVGKAREAALDYLVSRGGTITSAVSSRIWPGDSAVNVSMVNWLKGPAEGPFELVVDGATYALPQIPSHLQLHADVSATALLAANEAGASLGVIFGHEAFRASSNSFRADSLANPKVVRPLAGGDDLLRNKLSTAPDHCIYITQCATEQEARRLGGDAFHSLAKHVLPFIRARAESGKETAHYAAWLRKWWRPQQSREEFCARLAEKQRFIACPKVQARPVFAFLSSRFVPSDTLMVFAFDDDYTFGIMQSRLHWRWANAKGSKVTDRIQYTTDVWRTFPWPQEVPVSAIASVAGAGRALRATRDQLMRENNWSLRALYQAAEVDGPHPLKDAQHALDEAVAAAYGMPADQDVTEFLLELNKLLAEDEAQGRKINGPGLPSGLDPRDPRWFSTDCIEPPPFPKTDE